jgi:hypothetical protein
VVPAELLIAVMAVVTDLQERVDLVMRKSALSTKAEVEREPSLARGPCLPHRNNALAPAPDTGERAS